MQLIDGKAISELVKQEIAAEVAGIVAKGGKRPHLAAILVGHDGGSETYVAAKVKACEVCGFKSSLIRYEADVTEEELLAKVRELNEDADVDGFIVQLPLPKHISEQKVIETIEQTERDAHQQLVDCGIDMTDFCPANQHFLMMTIVQALIDRVHGIDRALARKIITMEAKRLNVSVNVEADSSR